MQRSRPGYAGEGPIMQTNQHKREAHGAPEHGTELDVDSHERVFDAPHPASEFDAGDGQGTVSGPPLDGGVLRHPILDGATQSDAAEATVPNPYRGVNDPGTIGKQPALNTATSTRWLLAGVFATVVVAIPLVLLARVDPVWTGIGLAAALIGLLLMLGARWMRMEQQRRLRTMAILLAWIWIVPVAVIVTVLITRSDQIFP